MGARYTIPLLVNVIWVYLSFFPVRKAVYAFIAENVCCKISLYQFE